MGKIGSNIVHIDFLLIDTCTLFLCICICRSILRSSLRSLVIIFANFLDDSIFHLLSLILPNLFFLFPLFPLLFFRFLLRTSRLIQRSKVDLSDYINLRDKLRLTDFKHIVFLFLRFSYLGSNRLLFCFLLFYHRGRFHFRLFFFYFFHLFFFYDRLRLFHSRLGLFSNHRLRFFYRLRFGSRNNHFFLLSFYNNWFHHICFFLLSHGNRLLWLRLRLWFRFLCRFFYRFLFSSPVIQFIQINFSDRFKLRACIFRNNRLDNILRLRLLGLFLITIDRYRCLVTILVLTLLDKTLRFNPKVFVSAELFHEYSILLLGNFGIGVCLNGIPLLLQEFNYR